MQIIDFIGYAIGIIGITVITWGALIAAIKIIQLEIKRIKGRNICKERELLRHHFGSYLLLGLEFLIAADVIHTIVKPDVQGLITLGSIVTIRTIIGYFLNKELRDAHNCQKETE